MHRILFLFIILFENHKYLWWNPRMGQLYKKNPQRTKRYRSIIMRNRQRELHLRNEILLNGDRFPISQSSSVFICFVALISTFLGTSCAILLSYLSRSEGDMILQIFKIATDWLKCLMEAAFAEQFVSSSYYYEKHKRRWRI